MVNKTSYIIVLLFVLWVLFRIINDTGFKKILVKKNSLQVSSIISFNKNRTGQQLRIFLIIFVILSKAYFFVSKSFYI